jgi:predicted DCC family thiol-disulfide oxidoreductase YuxK
VEPWDTGNRLQFRDYNDSAVAQETPFPVDELARQMHVHVPATGWFEGYRAWIEVLRVLPGWHWIARVAGIPPLSWIGQLSYRFFAANRYRIARWLPFLSMPVECDRCRLPAPKNT